MSKLHALSAADIRFLRENGFFKNREFKKKLRAEVEKGAIKLEPGAEI